MKPDTTEARRLADELAADVAALLREGLPQEAMRADAAQSAIRALADEHDSLRAEVAVLQMACSRWERALEHGADRIRIAESERDSLRAQVEALRADAERYRAVRDGKSHLYAICEWVDDDPNGIGFYEDGRQPDEIDAAIDAARAQE